MAYDTIDIEKVPSLQMNTFFRENSPLIYQNDFGLGSKLIPKF